MASARPLDSAHSASPVFELDHEVASHLDIEDDQEESDEEEGVQGSSIQQVPLSGAVAAVQTMAVVGRLTVMHDELDAGHAAVYSIRRRLTVSNDDYADLNINNESYVRRIYIAITTTPASMDDDQSKQAEVLAKKLKTFGGDADQYLAGKYYYYTMIDRVLY